MASQHDLSLLDLALQTIPDDFTADSLFELLHQTSPHNETSTGSVTSATTPNKGETATSRKGRRLCHEGRNITFKYRTKHGKETWLCIKAPRFTVRARRSCGEYGMVTVNPPHSTFCDSKLHKSCPVSGSAWLA